MKLEKKRRSNEPIVFFPSWLCFLDLFNPLHSDLETELQWRTDGFNSVWEAHSQEQEMKA